MIANPVLFAKAIADETRQKIMSECCCCWVSVGDLVSSREEGKQTFYTLNQENIVMCCGPLMIKFAPETATTEKLVKVINQ